MRFRSWECVGGRSKSKVYLQILAPPLGKSIYATAQDYTFILLFTQITQVTENYLFELIFTKKVYLY